MRRRSFTLVEMLVVLIIVGILAGVSFANYRKTKEDSMAKISENNLKTLKSSLDIYIMENGDMPITIDAGFILNQVAKQDTKILKNPSDDSPPSYGLNSILARMSKGSYDALPASTGIIGECDYATFNGDGNIAKKHRRYRVLPPGIDYYGLKITKDSQVVRVY